MRYHPYHELGGRPNVVVDGSPTDGTVLTVTHWPGYPPPEVVAADTSAEMAFRLLEHRELVGDVELVSNNHFDQDGLVSVHTLVDPDAATARRPFLEDVARAGDFATYRDRDAARVSMVLSAWADGRGGLELPPDYPSQVALLYETWTARLPELCEHVERHRHLWAEEDETLTASEAAIGRGVVTVTEDAALDLAILDVAAGAPDAGGHRFGGDWVHGLHPMAVHNATSCFVVATARGRRYDVEQRYESWVQFRSRPLRRRRDLAPLAAHLQDEELADAVWTATPVGSLVPRLVVDGESAIDRDRFVALLTEHLATAPPAWDPFSTTPGG